MTEKELEQAFLQDYRRVCEKHRLEICQETDRSGAIDELQWDDHWCDNLHAFRCARTDKYLNYTCPCKSCVAFREDQH